MLILKRNNYDIENIIKQINTIFFFINIVDNYIDNHSIINTKEFLRNTFYIAVTLSSSVPGKEKNLPVCKIKNSSQGYFSLLRKSFAIIIMLLLALSRDGCAIWYKPNQPICGCDWVIRNSLHRLCLFCFFLIVIISLIYQQN